MAKENLESIWIFFLFKPDQVFIKAQITKKNSQSKMENKGMIA